MATATFGVNRKYKMQSSGGVRLLIEFIYIAIISFCNRCITKGITTIQNGYFINLMIIEFSTKAHKYNT